jgi:hypothetical protein
MRLVILVLLLATPLYAAQPKPTEVTLATKQTYTPGTRSFGPVNVPTGTARIIATFDTSTHTTKEVTWSLHTEISRDGGTTWKTFVDILGGVPYSGNPASFSANIDPPADANTRMQGSYVIEGGNLQTEIKVTLE